MSNFRATDDARLPTMHGDYVEVEDGVHIYCRHTGVSDAPPLLLLHGNRDNHSHFAEMESILGGTHYTVAVDFRCHGLSSKPDCPLSPELFARDIERVMDHYGWESVTLIGHSLGSVTSLVLASRRPERIDRLVLLGCAATYKVGFKRPEMELTEETFPQFVAEANRRAGPFFFHDRYPEVQHRVLGSWSTVPLRVHRNLVRLEHPDLRPVVPGLGMPTLVIAGEYDKSTTVEHAQWIHEHLPGSTLFVVPDTAHFMYMEQPDLVADQIQEFLSAQRVEPQAASAVE
jgi:pimeloyl-ACP methyl ester carboxylesterase